MTEENPFRTTEEPNAREERRPETRVEEYRSAEHFDRVGFAMRLLARVHLPRVTVAVYERHHELRVERGRALTYGSTWAMLGIPPYASREHIALAVAELAGTARVPYAVDVLARHADDRVV